MYTYDKLFRPQIESSRNLILSLHGIGFPGMMLGLRKKTTEQQLKTFVTKKPLAKPTQRKKDFFSLTILGTVMTRKPCKQKCEAASYTL